MTGDHCQHATDRITRFERAQFPLNWDNWKGIGPVSVKRLMDNGIETPLQLLDKYFFNRNTEEFQTYLTAVGVSRPRMVALEVERWALIHVPLR